MAEDTMGKTDGVGLIVYVGTRAELEAKLRRRDDRITELEAALRSVRDIAWCADSVDEIRRRVDAALSSILGNN